MRQSSFAEAGFEHYSKRTRRGSDTRRSTEKAKCYGSSAPEKTQHRASTGLFFQESRSKSRIEE